MHTHKTARKSLVEVAPTIDYSNILEIPQHGHELELELRGADCTSLAASYLTVKLLICVPFPPLIVDISSATMIVWRIRWKIATVPCCVVYNDTHTRVSSS